MNPELEEPGSWYSLPDMPWGYVPCKARGLKLFVWYQIVKCDELDLDKLQKKAQKFYEKFLEEYDTCEGYDEIDVSKLVVDMILSCEK